MKILKVYMKNVNSKLKEAYKRGGVWYVFRKSLYHAGLLLSTSFFYRIFKRLEKAQAWPDIGFFIENVPSKIWGGGGGK